jgi:hypothetical protein
LGHRWAHKGWPQRRPCCCGLLQRMDLASCRSRIKRSTGATRTQSELKVHGKRPSMITLVDSAASPSHVPQGRRGRSPDGGQPPCLPAHAPVTSRPQVRGKCSAPSRSSVNWA